MTTLTRQEKVLVETPVGGDALPGGIREAAKRLGIGERKAYRMAERGEYPFSVFALRIGGVYVVPRHAFERFLRGELRPENTSAPAGQG